MTSRLFQAIFLSVVCVEAAAAGELATPEAIHAEAVKAYQAKDFKRFLTLERQASALAPEIPRYLYNVACAEALLGHSPEAVGALELLLDRKLDLGAQGDGDFSAIHDTPDWKRYVADLDRLRRPVVQSAAAFTLPDPDLIVCGIAIDGQTGDTYIGSLRERKILRRTKVGAVSDFVPEAQDGLLGVAALAIDAPRRLLYASTAGAPHMRGFQKEQDGRSGLFAFDLAHGRLVKKSFLSADGKKHFLNNLAIDHSGNVYVSDSLEAGIYRLRRNSSELERFGRIDGLLSTQGLALSADEKILFVTDWTQGLWALDLPSGAARPIASPPGTWLGGLDGLTRFQADFVAVQIGIQPARVLRLALDKNAQHVSTARILEMSHPGYDGPIQGTISDEAFFYIANSQLGLVDEKTGAFAADRARPTVILRLPLKPND